MRSTYLTFFQLDNHEKGVSNCVSTGMNEFQCIRHTKFPVRMDTLVMTESTEFLGEMYTLIMTLCVLYISSNRVGRKVQF